MKNKQIAGAALLVLGLVVTTGAVVNILQAPVAVAMLLMGGAWIQGMTVRDFVRRIISDETTKDDSVKHKTGTGRNYGNVAVFVGTACLFVGTPQECDEVADDLWHHAQQAEVKALTGDEVFDTL